MIDRRIAKIKLRRGTEAQRTGVVFEQGELVYAIDSQKMYIGDGFTPGGNIASNKLSINAGAPTTSLAIGDIYFDTVEYRGYIYDGTTWNLIGGAPDDVTIEYNGAFSLKDGGIQRDHLGAEVYKVGGGLSALSTQGIFINFDTSHFEVDGNGVFKAKPNAGISAYDSGAIVNTISGLSANVDNDTMQILGNKLAVKTIYNYQLYGDITPNKVTTTFVNSASGVSIDTNGIAIKTNSSQITFDVDGKLQLTTLSSQKSNNGYQVMQNGFVTQWGKTSPLSTNQFYTIILPLTTWAICYNVQVTMSYDSLVSNNFTPFIKNVTISSFDVALDYSSSTTTTDTAVVYWTALGYLTV